MERRGALWHSADKTHFCPSLTSGSGSERSGLKGTAAVAGLILQDISRSVYKFIHLINDAVSF